ncbi:MAG: transposase family protein [Bradyrhizobium sp.]|nr:transposase family protein [Bradyrhizobium sp.]
MRRISMATRDELLAAVSERYRGSSRADKKRIIDEFAAAAGYHRKHAMRVLRAGLSRSKRAAPRPSRRIYGEAEREALIVLWEASDRVCGKRLKAIIPTLIEAMERHGHLALTTELRMSLLRMSAATIDRALRPQREQCSPRRRRSGAISTIRRSIPVRTFSDWHDPPPGFVEADLVAHSGPVARGSFVQTLVITDIASGWTELAPLLVREQTVLVDVLREVRRRLPFPLLGFDTDNDTVFINETVRNYCAAEKIEFTRCRPYRKNDQAHVEQKNGDIVRRIVGYRRYEGIAAAEQLAKLYALARLFVNAFQPCFKLAEKTRNGAQVKKRYHKPLTPCDRVLTDPRVDASSRKRIAELRADLDPVRLLAEIRGAQQGLVALADVVDHASVETSRSKPTVPLDSFVAGLRTAWQGGEIRPTSQPKPKAKRSRRRPDPLVAVTDDLQSWFHADPSLSGRQLLDRLQAEHPGEYPDRLVRTVQRRLKIWRSAVAHELVFGRDQSVSEAAADA